VTQVREGSLLWQPTPEIAAAANLTRYMTWLSARRDRPLASYQELWRWSISELDAFWRSLWDYFEIVASAEATAVLSNPVMPGANWFNGARLNYAENFFIKMDLDKVAIIYQAEDQPLVQLTGRQLRQQTQRMATALRDLGVGPGDRVVAYLPNIPEAVVGLLACASLGAIWSSCSPDFGSRGVLDRFQQIEPKVLLAVDGYVYGGKVYDRREVLARLQAQLPTLERTILIPAVAGERGIAARLSKTILWDEFLAGAESEEFTFAQLPFDHPLWVLYSSGTTGLPKPIVHGHGGILLEHLKMTVLHLDLGPDDRFFWYTSTGWMMWNFLVGGLLAGSTIVLYNGSPGYPSLDVLWQLAANTRITYFGTSAAFVGACMKAGIWPGYHFGLSHLRALGSTGSPLPVEGFQWVYEKVNSDLALESVSGGTDLCTAFVGGCRLLPIYAGELQGPCLGASVQAYDDAGQPVVNEVGELVITRPMPSMPVTFWNDPSFARYKASYFDMYPGVWRHGDWIKFNDRGGCVIYGRSDSTINRQGVRMGTSEIYRVVETLPEVLDSLVVDLELLGRESYMPLFVVLRDGIELDETLRSRIRQAIRQEISPRHAPDDIFAVTQIPYTLSGKKMEVPVRRILLGYPVAEAANPGAMRNPDSIAFFVDLAEKLNA
jgi:acetoacetyl-CoA synthetase